MCDSIIAQLNSQPWTPHRFYNYTTNEMVTHEKDLEFSEHIVEEVEPLMQIIWNSLQQYFIELNFPWYSNWNGFTGIRWNRYNTGSLMQSHCDHIQSIFDGNRKGIPILSIIGILNDDYEGGELVMFEDKIIECKKGDLLVFPSNFLYPHRVDEVKSGTRFSFVSWVW